MNAYVLTGGRSRRMGESKVGLFLERVMSAAREVFDEVVAVGRAPSSAFGTFSPQAGRRISEGASPRAPFSPPRGEKVPKADEGCIRTIFDEREGAIFGVVRALQDARGKAFLLAVDYPLITSDVLRFLRDDGRMPEWNGRPQPLCAVWDAAWLPRIEQRIARGRRDLRGAAETEIIPESELRSRFTGEPLLNVNTPEEWERAQRFLASR